MAKTKDFGDLENNNKNIGNGVNALIKYPTQRKSIVKVENDKEDDIDLSNYPLRIPRSTLKALKTIALNHDTSVKDIIMIALQEKYNI